MTLQPDPIQAVVEYLAADSDLAALITHSGTVSVYGIELDAAETENMPRQAVVIKPAGGGAIPVAYQRYGDILVNALCYGDTPFEAGEVRRAVHTALKHLLPTVTANNTLLRWANPAGGPVSFRDPDTDWPVQMQAFQVMAAETAVS